MTTPAEAGDEGLKLTVGYYREPAEPPLTEDDIIGVSLNCGQARRLAARAMTRLNPRRSGTLITKLIGLRYVGKRWVKVQYPFLVDLADCVVEIQPSPKIDLLGGRVTFTWNLVDPAALSGLQ